MIYDHTNLTWWLNNKIIGFTFKIQNKRILLSDFFAGQMLQQLKIVWWFQPAFENEKQHKYEKTHLILNENHDIMWPT